LQYCSQYHLLDAAMKGLEEQALVMGATKRLKMKMGVTGVS
jgi:hypothetical protein